MLPADDRDDINSRHDPLKILPFKEDIENADETREDARHLREATLGAGAAESSANVRASQDAAQVESFSARLFALRWSVVAGACLLVAAACLLMGRMDAAFVVGTLGAVAWFWNERNRLRPHGIEAEERFRDEEEELENRDEE